MLQTAVVKVGLFAEAQGVQNTVAEFLSVFFGVAEKHREMAKAMLRKKGVLSGAIRQQPKPGAVRSAFLLNGGDNSGFSGSVRDAGRKSATRKVQFWKLGEHTTFY